MWAMHGNSEFRMGSDRTFGLAFAVVFGIAGLFPLLGGGGFRWWALAVAALLVLVSFAAGRYLRPLNRVWFRFGLFLNRIVSPATMGIIFSGVVTPTGLVRRLFVADPLRQRPDPAASSYWIKVSGPETSMRGQF